MKERSPFWLLCLMALILFSSGMRDVNVSVAQYLPGLISMLIFLFLVRSGDDICDIYIDKITHPGRLLCSNNTALRTLQRVRLILLAALLSLQSLRPDLLLFMLAVITFYGLFFVIKPRLNLLLQVALLNASLAVFPIYAGLLFTHGVHAFHWLMGIYFFLGGFAHDLSHALIDTSNKSAAQLNPINRINQRTLAVLSAVLFVLSAAAGILLYYHFALGRLFLFPLLAMIIVILVLEIRLIQKPVEENARPFYIFGFMFFMLPALGHGVNIMLP